MAKLPRRKEVTHGMLLDGKSVMDDALPTLLEIEDLVPQCLQDDLKSILDKFEGDLVDCDVSDDYDDIADKYKRLRGSALSLASGMNANLQDPPNFWKSAREIDPKLWENFLKALADD